MNVLFINDPQANFGEAFLYNGLCHLIGDANVYDYPYKASYHGETAHYDLPEDGIINGTTAPFPWMPARGRTTAERVPLTTGLTANDIDIRELLTGGFFQLVVIGSPRTVAMKTFRELKDAIRSANIPILLHDGEDYADFRKDIIEEVQPHFYLKRELLRSEPFTQKIGQTWVFPFPFSAPDEIVPDTLGDFDTAVTCLMGATHPDRAAIYEAINGVEGVHTGYTPDTGSMCTTGVHALLHFPDYIEKLRHSLFGISVRGHGIDTCRYWEVAVNTGLLCDDVQIHIPNPFQHGYTALFYRSPEEAKAACESIAKVGDNGPVRRIRQMGMNQARIHHTNSARVFWLLSQILN